MTRISNDNHTPSTNHSTQNTHWRRSDIISLISITTIIMIDAFAALITAYETDNLSINGGKCSNVPRICIIASGALTVITALFQTGLLIRDWRKAQPDSTLRHRICIACSIPIAFGVQWIASWGILKMCSNAALPTLN